MGILEVHDIPLYQSNKVRNTDVTFNEREYLKCTTYIRYNPMQENPKSAGDANVTV